MQLEWLLPGPVQRRSQRLRRWLASFVFVAIAWPALGLLPWLAVESAPHRHDGDHQGYEYAVERPTSAHHAHGDASDIPGSPTHPADHDCFQCQVLKHLSRCVVSPIEPPAIPLASGCQVQPRIRETSRHASGIAALPPARGPPFPTA
jgi:hypothetical protein